MGIFPQPYACRTLKPALVKKSQLSRLWDGWDGSWDGLGRTLGRIKCAKSSMFTGLGTVGRINWGGEGYISSKHPPSPRGSGAASQGQGRLQLPSQVWSDTGRRTLRQQLACKSQTRPVTLSARIVPAWPALRPERPRKWDGFPGSESARWFGPRALCRVPSLQRFDR